MANIHDAKIALSLQVKEYVQQAEYLFGVELNPIVRYDLKGTTAGTACTERDGTQILRFNLTGLHIDGVFDHLHDHTVPHEVAHLVQYNNTDWPTNRKANPPHGRYWQHVMRKFGVPADRCHSLPLPKAREQRKWAYRCNCRTHNISTTKHNRMQKDPNSYICRVCKGPIRFGGRAHASSGRRQSL